MNLPYMPFVIIFPWEGLCPTLRRPLTCWYRTIIALSADMNRVDVSIEVVLGAISVRTRATLESEGMVATMMAY